LGSIDTARRLVVQAADVVRRRAPELCVLSFLIWLLEFLICLLLVGAVTQVMGAAAELLGLRQAAYLGRSDDPTVGTVFAVTTIALLLPWPAMVLFYAARRRYEPRRIAAIFRGSGNGTP
jgi:uncharacterized membrane protein YbhN (UPF0104 family)